MGLVNRIVKYHSSKLSVLLLSLSLSSVAFPSVTFAEDLSGDNGTAPTSEVSSEAKAFTQPQAKAQPQPDPTIPLPAPEKINLAPGSLDADRFIRDTLPPETRREDFFRAVFDPKIGTLRVVKNEIAPQAQYIIYYLGDKIPDQLDRIHVHLEKSDEVVYEFRRVSKEELTRETERAVKVLLEGKNVGAYLLTFKDVPGTPKSEKEYNNTLLDIKDRIRQKINAIYGLRDGLTLKVPVDQTRSEKMYALGSAIFQSTILYFTLGAALQQKALEVALQHPSWAVHPLAGTLSMVAWVFATQYKNAYLTRLHSQGRTLQESPKGTKSVANLHYYLQSKIARSVLGKLVLYFFFFNSHALNTGNLESLLGNLVSSQAVNYGFEKWFTDVQARVLRNGQAAPQKGQLSQKISTVIWTTWQIAWGFVGNLQVVGVTKGIEIGVDLPLFGSNINGADAVYALGGVSVGIVVRRNWSTIKKLVERWITEPLLRWTPSRFAMETVLRTPIPLPIPPLPVVTECEALMIRQDLPNLHKQPHLDHAIVD